MRSTGRYTIYILLLLITVYHYYHFLFFTKLHNYFAHSKEPMNKSDYEHKQHTMDTACNFGLQTQWVSFDLKSAFSLVFEFD